MALNDENITTQMRKGVIDYCVLAILANGEAYAPSIISELKGAEMIVVEGTLYPTLNRLKDAGYLTYRWEESPQGPPRKYYSLTETGSRHLALLDASWTSLVQQIDSIRNNKH